jgi:serine/threonine protein kinase
MPELRTGPTVPAGDDPSVRAPQDADAAQAARPTDETSVSGARHGCEGAHLDAVRRALAGCFEVVRCLGRGGMGSVYLARRCADARLLVLKLMLSGRLSAPGFRARFEHEAAAAGRLSHPGIVPVRGYGNVNGQPYLVMDFVDGCNIRTYVAQHRLSPRAVCALALKVCRAVAYAHQKGVIHRDLKPTNIIVDRTGAPRLLDFGLAYTGVGYAASPEPDRAAEVSGTPAYMSPEQTVGGPRSLDVRSDIYSLGVVCYELLAGVPPYAVDRSRPLESLRTVRETVPPPPSAIRPGLDRDLDPIVMKCLEKDQESRYQNALELAADLETYLARESVRDRPAGKVYQLASFVRRLLGGAAGVLLALGVCGRA